MSEPSNRGASAKLNRYAQILEQLFFSRYHDGDQEVEFPREEIGTVARNLGIDPPKNLGDVVYSFRYRAPLPLSIQATAPPGQQWIIRSAGRSRYRLQLTSQNAITPNAMLIETKVPDSTPGPISMYALGDEQALLAKLRYNRLIDIFTGVVCYSLQNHLRTTVRGIGQIETDEIYIGIDRSGAHHVFPVQAKGPRDRVGIVQIEQDVALCAEKFPALICRPIAAQTMKGDVIALFECVLADGAIRIAREVHYHLVPHSAMTSADLDLYRSLSDQ